MGRVKGQIVSTLQSLSIPAPGAASKRVHFCGAAFSTIRIGIVRR
jgi:hypothetical protein